MLHGRQPQEVSAVTESENLTAGRGIPRLNRAAPPDLVVASPAGAPVAHVRDSERMATALRNTGAPQLLETRALVSPDDFSRFHDEGEGVPSSDGSSSSSLFNSAKSGSRQVVCFTCDLSTFAPKIGVSKEWSGAIAGQM